MRQKDIILTAQLKEKKPEIYDLGKYYPLGEVIHSHLVKMEYYHLDAWVETDNQSNFNDVSARFVRFTAKKDDEVSLRLGTGYIAEKDLAWEKPFKRTNGWGGADGIFSFNIEDGIDAYGHKDATTMFVFGDTLIGKANPDTKKRTDPLLMPSNTIAYLNRDKTGIESIEFKINLDDKQKVVAFLSPENPAVYEGTHPYNLLTDGKQGEGFISGYAPSKVEITFDFRVPKTISEMKLYNYFQKDSPDPSVMNRGLKHVTIHLSEDGTTFTPFKDITLEKAKREGDHETLALNRRIRSLKLEAEGTIGTGNHYGPGDDSEPLYALSKVVFFEDGKKLRDIDATSNTVLKKDKKDTWFWLQDGLVLNNHIYFLPLIITSDLEKPEGLQFAVEGVCMVKAPIDGKEVAFEKHTQKPTPLFNKHDGREMVFGAAIMNNTKEAGFKNGDGYVYIYGYSTTDGTREMHVARVLPDAFEDIDAWTFYKDGAWVDDVEEASGVLDNISCEMSVTPIETGVNEGKYLAVYQYNVDSDYVAYSIGDSPVGPFTEANIVYECEEPKTMKRKTYSYNAKAHPHLSSSGEILVTYNVNTYDMAHHYDNCEVYHPRFIRLKDTTHSFKDDKV